MALLDYQTYTSYFDPNHNGTDQGFLHMLDFLNTPRSGSAQNSAGITIRTFITSVMISFLYCAFQTSIFSLLRCKFKNIYQPNCYYIPDDVKLYPLEEGFFSWIKAALFHPLDDYKNIGLDAYFFIRYLCFLLVLFSGLAVFNLPVLIPVNYYSGYENYKPDDLIKYANGTIPKMTLGLDRISMSNIAPLYTKRLSIHLTMTVISILWFHGLVITELRNYLKIKNQYLAKKAQSGGRPELSRNSENTLLINNVPSNLLNRRDLSDVFNKLSGCKIKNIWFVYDYKDLKDFHINDVKLLDSIENLESKLITSKFFEIENDLIEDLSKYKYNKRLAGLRSVADFRVTFMYYVVPRGYILNRRLKLQETIDLYIDNRNQLKSKRSLLIARERGPLNDQKYNKVFIQFEDSFQPHLLNQIQISDKMNELDGTLIFVNPKDLIWENLSVQSNMQVFIRVLLGNTFGVIIILGWVIPVAFIGLVSQLPYLTVLIPFLSWLNYLPDYITDVISNFLSVILLVCLSELVPYIFRYLGYIKCKKTGAQVEVDVQNWMFIFSFIHIFMVVTISSGLTVIVEGLVNNPVSIPNILARNLPKCSNFFFSYLMIRGFSYFGNNLLQSVQLFKNLFVYPLVDSTPRRKFKRLASVPVYHWGSVYPTFAVLGSIGLIYSILSPLILIFCCVSFGLVIISFKYSARYQYSHDNPSENHGIFYPKAIFQLYSGIYFMEICLIGIFALSRDETNSANCLSHAFVTFVLLILTAAGQVQMNKMFNRLLSKNFPLTLYEPKEPKDKDESSNTKENQTTKVEHEDQIEAKQPNEDLFNDTFHHECFQHKNNIVWVPRDTHGISNIELQHLKELGIECSNQNTELTNDGELQIYSSPPDHIMDS
ncbi:putative membrane protein [Wickerhamomyces ciferrii]|uniref:Membrane protein n=1 Tax=Wickerhamomyces ciferrii (strain ATCC 14091 / BCRC 22168 / CBS 111 / JCM 3599 / NBRC 0793 / NRRL Y-1031 F-60-10) TaxID=1206466 RepID=K0KE73_WICCF|nr:uncharacterized protein BN7_753 [Wickerhamomyces ciferrii]CCH41216.1 putative membrane protein [Wickerhamomyces ciferrii]